MASKLAIPSLRMSARVGGLVAESSSGARAWLAVFLVEGCFAACASHLLVEM